MDKIRANASIADEAQCVVERVDQLISVGFSRIVLLKQMYVSLNTNSAISDLGSSPLERTPYFSADSFAGYGAYVRQNGTAVSIAIKQLVLANNALQSAYIPYHVAQASKASISFVRDC